MKQHDSIVRAAIGDSTAEAWVYLPKGTCERLTGGHVVNVKDPTPKK